MRPVEQMQRSLLLQHFLRTRQVLQPPQPLRMLQPLQPLQMRHGFNLLNPCDHCNLWNPCDHCNHSYRSPTDWTQPMMAYWIRRRFRIPFRFPAKQPCGLDATFQSHPSSPNFPQRTELKRISRCSGCSGLSGCSEFSGCSERKGKKAQNSTCCTAATELTQ